ncbi:MAG: methylated-DNA--[protein]-cysteine S-methyltransferase [Sedimentisphaerales bacterium]|nr:methylated-DNA--[protein]-cysteine S-methyltransferase [Sedimentisphaerales bacterium]
MQKVTKYTIFKTKWGYFGLAGNENGLCQTQLPGEKCEKIRSLLLKDYPEAKPDKDFCKYLQKQIIDYYEGKSVKFSGDIPLDFDRFTSFGKSVLKTCRNIETGRTVTYGQLAKKAGRPNASRAVGSVLAKNPMPLIIPCHRIVRSDGKLGGFSAPGGIDVKKKMLALECKAVGS